MKTIIELINSLNAILETQYPDRVKLIKELQNKIWNDEGIQGKKLNEILSELAYDLDFYEPNEKWRNEDPSYYGEDRLEKEIKLAIRKLKEQNLE